MCLSDVTSCVSDMSTTNVSVQPDTLEFPEYDAVVKHAGFSPRPAPTKPEAVGLLSGISDVQHTNAIQMVQAAISGCQNGVWSDSVKSAVQDIFTKQYNNDTIKWIAWVLAPDTMARMTPVSTSSTNPDPVSSYGTNMPTKTACIIMRLCHPRLR